MTDQEKREKAIKGLEEILQRFLVHKGIAVDRDGYEFAVVDPVLIKDALALLKAQEARVMTLDEAKSAFVIEYRSGKLKEAGMTILDLDVDPANAHYGVIYRVWTSRPTDEQRGATPWDA